MKAARLLTEGRVRVLTAEPRHLEAIVEGDTARHAVTYGHGAWTCTCPAYGQCSHRRAVQLISDPLGRWAP